MEKDELELFLRGQLDIEEPDELKEDASAPPQQQKSLDGAGGAAAVTQQPQNNNATSGATALPTHTPYQVMEYCQLEKNNGHILILKVFL